MMKKSTNTLKNKTDFLKQFNNVIDKTIQKNKILGNDTLWSLLNFVSTIVLLFFAVAIIILSASVGMQSTTIIFTYAGFLPMSIINILLSIMVLTLYYYHNQKDFYKKWLFYLPCSSLLFEIIILPILVGLATHGIANAGVLWSLLIFVMITLFANAILYVFIYKENDPIVYNFPKEEKISEKEKNTIDSNQI